MLSNKSNKELVEAGHQFAKALDADMPLTEIAKLVSALSTRLDCAIVRGNELQQKLDAMAAEVNGIREQAEDVYAAGYRHGHLNTVDGCAYATPVEDEFYHNALQVMLEVETPATDAYLNSVRAEGIHFAANRMLAAWECGFINDTPEQAHDISGAVLSALEFLPNASPEEFKRDYADEVRASIAASLRSGTHDTADKAGAK